MAVILKNYLACRSLKMTTRPSDLPNSPYRSSGRADMARFENKVVLVSGGRAARVPRRPAC